MGTTADKLNNILSTKLAIKQAIYDKGVIDITDVFSTYPSKILEIKSNGGTTYDWSEIGFPSEPDFITNGYNNAKTFKSTWVNEKRIEVKYKDNKDLIFLPNVDASLVELANQAFLNSSIMAISPFLKFPKLRESYQMFMGTALVSIPTLYMPNNLSWGDTFKDCKHLVTVEKQNTQHMTSFTSVFSGCSNLREVKELDFTNMASEGGTFLGCNNLRYILIKNLGNQDSHNTIDFTETKWGIDGDGITNCRQSLVDTLLNYSCNRTEKGYSIMRIMLTKETKDLLTSNEITQIQLKGYSIII